MSQHPDLDALARDIKGHTSLQGSVLLLVITFCLASIFAWAYLTELDDVTRADGRIVPSGDLQLIEATEPGVLRALFAREGQVVDQGEVLMEFDTTQIDSQLKQEQQRAFGLMARTQRLQAEIDGTDLRFTDALTQGAADVVRSETALYHGRQAELRAEIAILERQRQQKTREFEEGIADRLTAEETLRVLAEERAMMAPLVARNMEPATTLLSLRRSEAEWEGHKVRAQAAVLRLQTGLEEVDDRITAAYSRFRSSALTDLAATTAELAALQPVLPALRDRASRAQIRAPMRGIVNRIHRTTIGGLARGGEELVEIVPLGKSLLVETYVKPEDIAFLHAGQRVKVKITAYDFARYGGLDGEIVRIAANTSTRSEKNDEEIYIVEVKTVNTMLDAGGSAVEIIPGMVAEVDILSGRKTVLEYLMNPVVKIKDRALRE